MRLPAPGRRSPRIRYRRLPDGASRGDVGPADRGNMLTLERAILVLLLGLIAACGNVTRESSYASFDSIQQLANASEYLIEGEVLDHAVPSEIDPGSDFQ